MAEEKKDNKSRETRREERPKLHVVTSPVPIEPVSSANGGAGSGGFLNFLKEHPYLDAGAAALLLVGGYLLYEHYHNSSSTTAATTASTSSSGSGSAGYDGGFGNPAGYVGGGSGGGSTGSTGASSGISGVLDPTLQSLDQAISKLTSALSKSKTSVPSTTTTTPPTLIVTPPTTTTSVTMPTITPNKPGTYSEPPIIPVSSQSNAYSASTSKSVFNRAGVNQNYKYAGAAPTPAGLSSSKALSTTAQYTFGSEPQSTPQPHKAVAKTPSYSYYEPPIISSQTSHPTTRLHPYGSAG